jgi:outer membrane protein assembly factor BamB
MKKLEAAKLILLMPMFAGIVAATALSLWLVRGPDSRLLLRLPGADQAPEGSDSNAANPVLAGKLLPGDGKPADLPGAWAGFRGPTRTGISAENNLARTWDSHGPRELWSVDVGEGYAGAAVLNGRVYLMDYDRPKKQDALRCLSLADGKEIWRFAYSMTVKRNHGMSRTVPSVTDKFVVAMGPKCHVVCLDAVTGALHWGLDLVKDYGTEVPQWYAGQCPLIENGKVILAPGGKDALLMAVDIESGKVLWQTPNPRKWKMTHASIMPMEFAGQRMYVYCGDRGVAGVSAKDGSLLWETTDWRISIATVPTPLVFDDGRIFLSGGYDAGSMMLQLKQDGGKFVAQTLFKLQPTVFGATQQTPICSDKYIYGVRPDGQFVCIDLNGKPVWASGQGQQFGLGPFMMAGNLIFVMNDSGKLSLIDATPAKFNLLAEAQVLKGHESWGPMTLACGRLIVRDLSKIACLDVAAH